MFAVIRTGGKQYKVSPGDVLKVEKVDCQEGGVIRVEDVLMICPEGDGERIVGTPTITGAVVTANVLRQERAKKVISFKKRRRKASSQRKKGHRQHLSVLEVVSIFTP